MRWEADRLSARGVAAPRAPTAVLGAGGLIAGYGVAVATGSRPLGGLVLAACGLPCVAIWTRRHPPRTTGMLVAIGLSAFALSHVVGRLVGAWPAVLLSAAATGAAYWRLSDSGRPAAAGRR